MTYQELSTKLITLGQGLQSHPATLSGESAAKVVKTLGDAADKLATMLRAAIKQASPAACELRDLLSSESKVFDAPTLKVLAKKLAIKLPAGKSATLANQRERLVSLAADAEIADKALRLAKTLAEAHAAPPPSPTSHDDSLRALLRLGAKSEDEIELELSVGYSDDILRTLAAAAGLKVTTRTKRVDLIPKLIHHARRMFENTYTGSGE